MMNALTPKYRHHRAGSNSYSILDIARPCKFLLKPSREIALIT